MLFLSTCWKVTDFKTPIVLDTGSGLMKAGFADEDLPNVVFPTIIGMPKYEVDGSICPFTQGTEVIPVWLLDKPCLLCTLSSQEIMNGRAERETYIGHEAQHLRGVLVLKRPIKNGIIQNWDEMEQVNKHISIMCIFLITHSCHSNPCG